MESSEQTADTVIQAEETKVSRFKNIISANKPKTDGAANNSQTNVLDQDLLKFRIPLHLDQLLQLNVEHLRDVIEEIIKTMNRQQFTLTGTSSSIFKCNSTIHDMKKEFKEIKHEEKLHGTLSSIENLALNQQLIKRNISGVTSNYEEIEEKINDLVNKIQGFELLRQSSNKLPENGMDFSFDNRQVSQQFNTNVEDRLKKLEEQILKKANIQESQVSNINPISNDDSVIQELIKKQESKVQIHQQQIEGLQRNNQKTLSQIEQIFNELQSLKQSLDSKVNKLQFDQDIAALQKIKTPGIMQRKEQSNQNVVTFQQDQLNNLSDINIKLLNHEESIKDIISHYSKYNFDDFFANLQHLQKQQTQDKEHNLKTFDQNKISMDQLQKQINNINTFVQNTQSKLNQLNDSMNKQSVINENFANKLQEIVRGIQGLRSQSVTSTKIPETNYTSMNRSSQLEDQDLLFEINDEIRQIKEEFQNFKKSGGSFLISQNLQTPINLDQASAVQLEQSIVERVNQALAQFGQNFIPKDDLQRNIHQVESNMKQYVERAFTNNSPRRDDSDDAMLSRKPLNGTFCASCDKELVNLYQKQNEFQIWNKMPFRNPGERIAKVGQGFSKMLAMVSPQSTMSQLNKTSSKFIPNSSVYKSLTRVPQLKDISSQDFMRMPETTDSKRDSSRNKFVQKNRKLMTMKRPIGIKTANNSDDDMNPNILDQSSNQLPLIAKSRRNQDQSQMKTYLIQIE
ncbi:UNKNOWN [Stylonychia lemnae]|uniref:Uncharacterized protein n=1 Tax=Stylonychia lemnae TaxID=5949 RepID=A0A078AXT3_STYLE|nr:UNKNOWN [Stylonychia lemnae]|eukprot:CDW87260.1 UNKNOWN [Stylonychia lemnae]